MVVESFLNARRKHLTRVTSSVKTLEQSLLVVPRRSICALSHGRRLHSDDHRRVCLLGLVARCPSRNQSHEFQSGVAASVSVLDSAVFISAAHNRHRIAERFGSFLVSTHFNQIFLPGVDCISDSLTHILTSTS